MKLDGYQLVSDILLEVSTLSVGSRLTKRVLKDPLTIPTMVAVPGGLALGPANHMRRYPRSKQMALLLGRKLGIKSLQKKPKVG